MTSFLIICSRAGKLLLILKLYYRKWVAESEERLVTCLFSVTIQCFDIKDQTRAKYSFERRSICERDFLQLIFAGFIDAGGL